MNVPKLRFKEFNDEWKYEPLSNYVERIITKNKDNISSLVLTISAQSGLVDQTRFFNKNVSSNNLAGYYLLNKGDFAYNKSYSNGYPWGAIKRLNKYDKGVVSSLYICFKPNKKINSNYLEQYFETNKWYHQMSEVSVEGARNHGLLNIAVGDFFSTEHFIPTLDEQKKISKFLSLLDKKIELQSKKIEDLKLFKLYIRNKIFSGIKTKDKIINTLNYEQPNRYIVKSEDYLNDENLIPVLTANKAFILGYCNENDYYNKGDVIIFDDFTMDSKYVNFNFKIKSSAIKLLTQKNNNNLKYIFECLQALNLESTEHKRHYISIVQEIEIPVPDITVQNKIANLMFMYDKKIKLESDNYNKLIELKKGLMQSMFV